MDRGMGLDADGGGACASSSSMERDGEVGDCVCEREYEIRRTAGRGPVLEASGVSEGCDLGDWPMAVEGEDACGAAVGVGRPYEWGTLSYDMP